MTTKEVLLSIPREEGTKFLNSKKSNEEIYDILVKRGLTDSYETFLSSAKEVMQEKLFQMSKDEIMDQLSSIELSEKDLATVAGGLDGESFGKGAFVGFTVGVLFAGGVAIAAASAA